MKLNNKWLFALLLALVLGIYAFLFHDWFGSIPVKIDHRILFGRAVWGKPRRGTAPDPNAPVVTFGFDRKLKLTAVKVFLLPELATNQNAQPLWHLVSDSNSIPVKGISYGARIWGMRPFVKGARPGALTDGAAYRLFIEAGSLKAQHDFSLGESTPAPSAN